MKWRREFIRYAVVGAGANIGGYLLYVLFTKLGVSPVLTISLFYPVHIGATFYFNKKWTFIHKGRLPVPAVRYLISYSGCYVLNVSALKIFSGSLGFSHFIVQAVTVVIIALLLFLAQKYWVFSAQGSSKPYAEA